jgi:hypothetical protein
MVVVSTAMVNKITPAAEMEICLVNDDREKILMADLSKVMNQCKRPPHNPIG